MLQQFDSLTRDAMLFDAIDSGLIVLNQKGEVVVWNKWMIQHSFIDSEKALKQTFLMLFPDMSKRLQMAVSDALSQHLSSIISARLELSVLPLYQNEESFQLDKRIPHSLTVTPVQMQQQHWCLIQVKDATRRENMEIALKRTVLEIDTMVSKSKEQEFQLQTILNNTLDSIVILNRLGRISGFYSSAQKMFGYSEYELLGKPLSVLFPSPFNRSFEMLINEAKDDEPFSVFEQAKSLKSNGEIFHSDIAINSIFEGEDMQFIITIKDITERQIAQDALYREKEQAQVTLSSIADGVITTDIIGQINFINPAALKLTGYKHEELINKRIDRVITIQSDNNLFPVFQCIESGQQVDSISGDVLISKSGSQLVIHQVASPIHNQLGDIIGAVMIFRDVSKSHRLASRLSWQASHDELTQLFNRREFENQLERFIDSARNESSQHCLCYMDLDKFKVVNDTCGHAAGDELLRQLADIFRTKIRGADTLSRLGGDEFAIILNKCGLGPAVNIAEEIRATIEDFRFGWDDQSFQVGISIGLVLIDIDSPDQEEVFKAADSACYAAKEAGRNRVHIYSPDDTEISQRRGESRWMVRIQNALDQDRFQLNYQPIIGISEGSADSIHYEILLRMLSEDGELIPPGAFMSSAERYLLMPKIDIWVIENLFCWLSQHGDYNSSDIFAINLSGQSLADESLLYRIKQLFNEYSIPAKRISFEITETAAISNLSQAQVFIAELKQLGCKFALDDFGSGLSSFAYLKSLPVDYLKIDGAFVKDMVDDPIDRAMVESIHNIGSVLKLKTIAEFVENAEILSALKEVGVDFAQGYGIARPKPLPTDGSKLF
ncbi:MAG: EAL domain-containing protein [Gammaproteobacteria bacterium]|nr:EAL domain-containing protein [Gammaproteobacteria bacterium]MBT3723254.1 EAL domain-containing protein [Gammaproteobacteria bacterium]MBT4077827.1 EAL domain-containing protein [Gammaproteobacteria bacterium]MBT4450188.1 EAL domain-containing protein [Gammaproteobacteria bacterium]MBT4861310.1 EAL domain-containing protein [Gammaproteobacteria bacterium]